MPKKNLSNRQKLAKLAREADNMTLVVIIERLMTFASSVKDAEKVRAEWTQEWVSPELYIEAGKDITGIIGE